MRGFPDACATWNDRFFFIWRALAASADGGWAMRMSSAGEMGCGKRLGHGGEKVKHKENKNG